MATVWFARRASQNINANDGSTWNTKADGTGGWLVWATGRTDQDVWCANGNAGIIINLSMTAARFSTAAEVGVSDTGVSGGGFAINAAVTVVANIVAGATNSTQVVSISGTQTVNITGAVTGGSGTNCYGLYTNFSAGGVLNLSTTALTGGAGSSGHGLVINGGGTHTITGTGAGPHVIGNVGFGIRNYSASAVLVINGNVSGGSGSTNGYGVMQNSTNAVTGSTTINGSVSGGAAAQAASGVAATGCAGENLGIIIITGNLINTPAASAVRGAVLWQPASVNNYIEFQYTAGVTHRYGRPAANTVIEGTTVGDVAGTYEEVAPVNVIFAVEYGDTAAPQVGVYGIPSPDAVLVTESYGVGLTGSYVPAVEDNVRLGTNFGPSSPEVPGGFLSGDLALPTAAQVLDGVGFGADGTEFTGELAQGGCPLIGGGGLAG
jgi:hypothetical protein